MVRQNLSVHTNKVGKEKSIEKNALIYIKKILRNRYDHQENYEGQEQDIFCTDGHPQTPSYSDKVNQ